MHQLESDSFILSLRGLPPSGDSLLSSILHQLKITRDSLTKSPSTLQLSSMRICVSEFLRERGRVGDLGESFAILSPNHVGGYPIISVINQWLDVTIEVFTEKGCRRTYPALTSGRPVIQILRYQLPNQQIHYDSILSATLQANQVTALRRRFELHVGTWNLSGVTSVEKRLIIDEIAKNHRIDILCVQETHLYSQSVETPNYHWILGPQSQLLRASRGCGFLIRKGLPYTVELQVHSVNILQLTIKFADDAPVLYLLCVHRVSEGGARSALEAGKLTSIARELKAKGGLVIVGDFNSHLGRDLYDNNQRVIGSILYHEVSNTNGKGLYHLCENLELQVLTTIKNRSTRCTWYRANGSSQIDHVIAPLHADFHVSCLKGHWTKFSDHKLITFNLHIPSPRKFETKL